MENSSFLHRSLMKRRYSVPETIMRKHNLREVALRKQMSDSVVTKISSSSNLASTPDEMPCRTETSPVQEPTWIDEEQKLTASKKKNPLRNKRRKSFRISRKSSSSYCQYRYSMSAFNKQILARRGSKLRNSHSHLENPDESDNRENAHCMNSVKYSGDTNTESIVLSNDLDRDSAIRNKSISKRLPGIKEFPACPQRMTDLLANSCGDNQNTTNNETSLQNLQTWKTDFPLIVQSESVFFRPSQTSGCSTRETHSISIEILPSCKSKYPDKNDYFQTQVRIGRQVENQVNHDSDVSSGGFERKQTDHKRQYVQVANEIEKEFQESVAELKPKNISTCDHLHRPIAIKTAERTLDSSLTSVKFFDEVRVTCRPPDNYSPQAANGDDNIQRVSSNSENEDCAVPMSLLNCSPKRNGSQQLNIQVSIGKIGGFENDVSQSKKEPAVLPLCSNDYQKPANKNESNTKMALSYLFQKLGSAYPKPQKRFLLKDPTFVNYHSRSQFGQYYSGLPKLSDLRKPSPVSFSKHSRSEKKSSSIILPDALATKKLDDCEHSDSDISIADSLEDSHQSKPEMSEDKRAPAFSRYNKYDERIARGDVDKLVQSLVKKNEATDRTVVNGISYFLQFSSIENGSDGYDNVHQEIVDNFVPHMPNNLLEKLNRRSNSISKHSSCLETCRSREFVHKQIQTCFNARESLRRKRRPRLSQSSSDERIAKILITGLEMQEAEKLSPRLEKPKSPGGKIAVIDENVGEPQTDCPTDERSMFNGVDGESHLYDMILREEEIEQINTASFDYYRASEKSRRFHYSMDTLEDTDKVQNTQKSSTYRHQKNKSRYSEERKIQKRRADKQMRHNGDFQSNDSAVRKFVSKDSKVKNSKTKFFGPRNLQRFYQKFEAIPEEMTSGLNERHDGIERKNEPAFNLDLENGEDITDRYRYYTFTNSETATDNANNKCVKCTEEIRTLNLNTNTRIAGAGHSDSTDRKDQPNNKFASNLIDTESGDENKLDLFNSKLKACDDKNSATIERKNELQKPDQNPRAIVNDGSSRSNITSCTSNPIDVDHPSSSPNIKIPVQNSDEKCMMNNKTEKSITAQEPQINDSTFVSQPENKNESSNETVESPKAKSQKREDLLYSASAKEELVTLSKGWINFYLWKAGNVGVDGATNITEDAEKEEKAPLEDLLSPRRRQYLLHIQAVPQTHSDLEFDTPGGHQTQTLSELGQTREITPSSHRAVESKWQNISSRTNSTSFSGVKNPKSSPPNHRVNISSRINDEYQDVDVEADNIVASQITNDKICPSLRKVRPSRLDIETDIGHCPQLTKNRNDVVVLSNTTEYEPESVSDNNTMVALSSFWPESLPAPSSPSSAVNARSSSSTSATGISNCSSSSASNEIGVSLLQTDTIIEDDNKNIRNYRSRNAQYFLRPQTHHSSTRPDAYHRSSSVGGIRKSADRKNSTGTVDIEMRLLVKNHVYEDDNSNRTHSWKFTLTNDGSNNSNKIQRSSKSQCASNTSNRNLNQQHQNRIVKLSGSSETTSTSTSICSLNERKRNKEAKFIAKYELSSYPLRPDNNLTVTGSSMTPKSKPKPPTMSERDLTRARFSKYTNSINKL